MHTTFRRAVLEKAVEAVLGDVLAGYFVLGVMRRREEHRGDVGGGGYLELLVFLLGGEDFLLY